MAKLTRSSLYLVALTFTLIGNLFAADSPHSSTIEEVRDFAQLGRTLQQQRLPLVLMFSASHCGYCLRVEQEFLGPMQISGYYEGRALIRKVQIDQGNLVIDFSGQRVEASQLAQRYHVTVTPTVLFLDGTGRELTARRVGLMTPDFYGGYLDESITAAFDLLRRNRPLRVDFGATMNF